MKLLFWLVGYFSGSKCQQPFTWEIGSTVSSKLELWVPLGGGTARAVDTVYHLKSNNYVS